MPVIPGMRTSVSTRLKSRARIRLERGARVVGGVDRVALAAQRLLHPGAQALVVHHEESDLGLIHGRPPSAQQELQDKHRAAGRGVSRADGAPMREHDLLDDPQPETACLRLCGHERFEDDGLPFRRDAGAGVLHRDQHPPARRIKPRVDLDVPGADDRLDGVEDEIHQRLRELHRVGGQRGRSRAAVKAISMLWAAASGAEEFAHVVDHRGTSTGVQ